MFLLLELLFNTHKSEYTAVQGPEREPFLQFIETGPAPALLMQRILQHKLTDQEVMVISAAAPSGTGKTHLAYAAGRRSALSVVHTVLFTSTSSWSVLDGYLSELNSLRGNVQDRSNFIPESAERHVKLYVFCLVDVVRHLFRFAEASNIRGPVLHELFLRFFSNHDSDKILADSFKRHRKIFTTVCWSLPEIVLIGRGMWACEWEHSVLHDIKRMLPLAYAEGCSAKAGECRTRILFCFDEAALLVDKFSGLFTASQSGWRRDLLDVLSTKTTDVVVLVGIDISAAYYTGTTLSMENVLAREHFTSRVRNGVEEIAPNQTAQCA